MRICTCSNRFPPNIVGGAELVAYELSRNLKNKGHEMSFLTLSDTRVSALYEMDGLNVDRMMNANVYNQFSARTRSTLLRVIFGAVDCFNPIVFFLALRHLKTYRTEVLCSHNLKGMGPAVWLAARLLKIPIVHVIHDYWLVCPTSTMFRNGSACGNCCGSCRRVSAPKAWFSRVVNHVVGVSRFALKQHLDAGFFVGVERSVIHNSRPPLMKSSRLPAEEHSSFRVGFIGRVDATKGISQFFASVIAAQTPNIEVHVAGRDNNGILKELIIAHPQLRVVHHGFVDPGDFYDLVDLVVVSSMWNEPFATVSFEPWEFSKPSVAFSVGGLPEVYACFPELTVPRGDVAALGDLIKRLACDHEFYDSVARQCRVHREYFLPQRQVAEFERVLLSVREPVHRC